MEDAMASPRVGPPHKRSRDSTPPGGRSRSDPETTCDKCHSPRTSQKDPIMLCSSKEPCQAATHRSCAGLTKAPGQWFCIVHGKPVPIPAPPLSGAAAS